METAFLHGELKEDIYILAPQGMPNTRPGQIFKLNKTLYGLKQASNEWGKKLRNAIINSLGYTQCKYSDESVFVKVSKTGKTMILATWVDDILRLCYSQDLAELESDLVLLSTHFAIKDLGDAEHILGIRIRRNRAKRELIMDQEAYITRILAERGFLNCRPCSVPASKIGVESSTFNQENPSQIDAKQELKAALSAHPDVGDSRGSEFPQVRLADYKSVQGELQYAATWTRPDIAYAVSQTARYMSNPQLHHLQALKQILRYLSSTKDLGIRYSAQQDDDNSSPRLSCFSDSDWANDPTDRRSVSGKLVKLSGGPIVGSSKKQPTVSLSSTEAEYIAASEMAREIIWLRRLCQDIGIKQTKPTIISIDNQTAISMATEDGNLNRRKHIDTKHHHIKEKIEDQIVELKWIPTSENEADIFTKPLTKALFIPLRQRMMGWD